MFLYILQYLNLSNMSTKRTLLLSLFVFVFYNLNSQTDSEFINTESNSEFINSLSVEFGLNLVDNSGNANPLTAVKEFSSIAYSLPFKIDVNYSLSDAFQVFLSSSSNKFREDQIVDNKHLDKSYNYLSIDLGLKYDVFEVDLNRTSIVGFAQAGVGVFKIESSSPSANLGFGGLISLTDMIDVVISSVAKFSMNNEYLNSNHFQYFLGLKFKLGKGRFNDVSPIIN